ncbi:MAG TPA: DNA mismatch repair protein MutT [Prolixibacteraceae bacterium]|jgi:mutator protein MutT|nr:DNA mismatch repair protein MutT [Prolixibacteraceae bacterium]
MYSNTHPVNVLKFCPRCGSAQFMATGSRSFLCKDCSFNYYVNASSAVAVLLFNEKGELLFTRRAIEPHFGKLDLPGGFIDPMESAEQAAVREIKEELGIQIHSLKYFCSYPNEYIFSGFSVYTLDLAFMAQTESLHQMTPMDDISSFEFIQPKSVDLKELPSISMKNILKELIQREGTY